MEPEAGAEAIQERFSPVRPYGSGIDEKRTTATAWTAGA
jgi:hypothetical protein